MKRRLVIIHPMDPRGAKVGGIETHVRLLLRQAPADFSVALIGVDERGDLELGKPLRLQLEGRHFDFLPVLHYPEEAMREAARRIRDSLTFRFGLAMVRHLGAIRRLKGTGPVSADVQRFEFTPIARLAGLPVLQQIHGEGRKGQKMDSLIARHWGIYRAGEALALTLCSRAICVTPARVEELRQRYPRHADKIGFMSVSVDTEVFRPMPFDTADGVFRVVFAGRFDAFKDPPLMFSVLAELRRLLGDRLEFHYIGSSGTERFAEFDAIADITIRHGFQDRAGVARILGRAHAGILTSYFEGLPCYMMEVLASGRPLGVIRLPQFQITTVPYAPLMVEGETGFLMERDEDDRPGMARAMAARFAALWADIRAGRLDPERIAAHVGPYSVAEQLPRLFDLHRAIQDGRPVARGRPVSAAG
ncbi:MAG TPA: glycosyltransferase family 1 protein [Thermopetrobacter sp.]|nr:glycosyltransferase family 1 protein [Thermopetrobacter sp.]